MNEASMMSRRNAMLGIGATAAAVGGMSSLLATASTALGQDKAGKMMEKGEKMTGHKDHWDHCLAQCVECMTACNAASTHCTGKLAAGEKNYLDCTVLCADCPELCTACAHLMARRSPLTATIATACATACDTCAAACEKLSGDPVMLDLAKTCRACAESCREMVKLLAAK